MLGNPLPGWLLNFSYFIVVSGLNILVQSTGIIALGIFIAAALKRRGAAVQSAVLRLFLVAVFLSPLGSIIIGAAVIHGLTFEIPSVSIEYPGSFPASEEKRETVYNTQLPGKKSSGGEGYSPETFNGKGHFPRLFCPVENRRNQGYPQKKVQNHNETVLSRNKTVYANTDSDFSEKRTKPYNQIQVGKTQQRSSQNRWSYFYILAAAIWAIFSLFLLMKLFMANLYIYYVRRSAHRVKPSFIKKCSAIAHEIGVTPPLVLQSESISSPILAGLFKPFILLPPGELEVSLTLREVFVHELSHLKRHDFFWNQLRHIGKIIVPFQPLMWVLSHWIEETADYVCDDYVMRYTENHRSYAASLLTFSNCCYPEMREIQAGVGFISFKSPLRRRIMRILDSSRVPSLKAGAYSLLCISLLCFLTICGTGLVCFRGKRIIAVSNASELPIETRISVRSPEFRSEQRSTRGISLSENSIEKVPAEHVSAVKEISDKTVTGIRDDITNNLGKTLQSEEKISESAYPVKRSVDNTALSPETEEADFLSMSARTVSENKPEATVGNDIPAGAVNRDMNLVQSSFGSTDASVPEQFHEAGEEEETNVELEKETGEPETAGSDLITAENPGNAVTDLLNGGNLSYGIPVIRKNSIKISFPEQVHSTVDYFQDDIALKIQREKNQRIIYYGLNNCSSEPVWSPDGKWIAFTDFNRIWIVSSGGGEPKLIYENIHYYTDHFEKQYENSFDY